MANTEHQMILPGAIITPKPTLKDKIFHLGLLWGFERNVNIVRVVKRMLRQLIAALATF